MFWLQQQQQQQQQQQRSHRTCLFAEAPNLISRLFETQHTWLTNVAPRI